MLRLAQPKSRGLVPGRASEFHPEVQNCSGVKPTSYTMDTGTFPGVKGLLREADRSTHVMVRLRMIGAVPPLLHMN